MHKPAVTDGNGLVSDAARTSERGGAISLGCRRRSRLRYFCLRLLPSLAPATKPVETRWRR